MFISILLGKVREMMDLEEMELKELKENLRYKEGYLKEKINTYDQKRKKYKIIAIGAFVGFAILWCVAQYLDSWEIEGEAAFLFSAGIVGPVAELSLAIGAVSLFFGIRHHLYTHVYDVIRLGPVHIGPSQNLLSDIREREGEVLMLKNKIDELEEMEFERNNMIQYLYFFDGIKKD